ncbi:UDP-N-acetylglucosamine 1-carboxyvinyltransferase, partial [Patescibacteria group bacterium]|nr:UDP-N-acetylglucosamine 1-carboxyvinyltransferase [Patescibacteria group bacterium]
MKYIIKGGKQLKGMIAVSGNKNSIFPCVAAALLTREEVVLDNIPQLKDTAVLIEILKKLGVQVKQEGHSLHITAKELRRSTLPEDLMVKLRGAVVLAGALFARLGRVSFSHPGGDIIGRRSIQTHLDGFKALGATIKREKLSYNLTASEVNPQSIEIFLPEASVTATENLILATVLGNRTVILQNCATEPHVVDLCQLLVAMGGRISGIGTDTITIIGTEKLHDAKFSIGPDYIEAGTYIVAAAVTGGEITITGINQANLAPILLPLQTFNIKITKEKDKLQASPIRLKLPPKLVTNVWPGFPTDLMSVAIVLATQSKGVILCHDWMYEGRMFFTDKLITMGAKITLADPHRVVIYGPCKLRGRVLETPDIRAGMALVVAALAARGTSVINQAELIERG